MEFSREVSRMMQDEFRRRMRAHTEFLEWIKSDKGTGTLRVRKPVIGKSGSLDNYNRVMAAVDNALLLNNHGESNDDGVSNIHRDR